MSWMVALDATVPDEASLGPVDKVHAVGCVVLPAGFIGVVPQCSDLKQTHETLRRTRALCVFSSVLDRFEFRQT